MPAHLQEELNGVSAQLNEIGFAASPSNMTSMVFGTLERLPLTQVRKEKSVFSDQTAMRISTD